MKRKVAIIDHLGAHGSSHHFYLFGQARGLIENNLLYNSKSIRLLYFSSLEILLALVIDILIGFDNISIYLVYKFVYKFQLIFQILSNLLCNILI